MVEALIRAIMSLDEPFLTAKIFIYSMSVVKMSNKVWWEIFWVASWSRTADGTHNFEMLIILELRLISAVMARLKITYHMIDKSIDTFAYMLIAEWTFVLMKEYFFLDYLQLDLILDIFIFQITMLAVIFFLKGLAKLLILIE